MENKLKILVIDDQKDLTEVLNLALTQRGYVVKVATTGSEAVNICSDESFDLIITDLNMPEMDGVQLIGNIRKLNPHQRIIVATAHPWQWTPWNKRLISRDLAEEVVKHEEIKCLPKPFRMAQLMEMITETLQGNGKG
ncbi:response regulator [candidate division WOR-3 bacterium]|uniref:Response regulator n=1 Tax=candidate division WOR-3 bacterium TaxID=2052148 RepID=A0A9D5QE20_UNCW3|nr:response regulator [candidate division WOR-3 bacterium]MBD3365651.1 response regulator [candidate division WOR-3 bacterium]